MSEVITSIESLPLALTVEEFRRALNIGRNQAYQLVNDGTVKALRVGTAIRIPRTEVARLLNPA